MADETRMDGDQQFTIQWVKWLVIAGLGFATLMVGSCQMTNFLIYQGIKAGADPLTARCALDASGQTDCLLKYAEHGR